MYKRQYVSILGLDSASSEDPGYSRRFLQVIFSTFFFLSILQRRPRIFKECVYELIENNISYLQRRLSILKEVFWPFIPFFPILQRPSIFKEVFRPFIPLFSILQRRPSILKEVFLHFLALFKTLPRPNISKEVI